METIEVPQMITLGTNWSALKKRDHVKHSWVLLLDVHYLPSSFVFLNDFPIDCIPYLTLKVLIFHRKPSYQEWQRVHSVNFLQSENSIFIYSPKQTESLLLWLLWLEELLGYDNKPDSTEGYLPYFIHSNVCFRIVMGGKNLCSHLFSDIK